MVAPVEVTVDAKGMPLPPVDPNIPVPPSVKAAADKAAALHQAAYSSPQPDAHLATVASTTPVTSALAAAATPDPGDPRASWTADKWIQHAKSMEGRFNQSQDTIKGLQTTLSEMGAELVAVQQPRAVTSVAPVVQQNVTPKDLADYGEDFLAVVGRVATDVAQPRIAQLEAENRRLSAQMSRQAGSNIYSMLDDKVPNWATINGSPRFKTWLRSRDIYAGRLRQQLLDDAFRAADAARVVAFFQGFLKEEEATGSTEFLLNTEPPPGAAPRNPAVELQTLAAPGHARPAVATSPNSPANEPRYITRGQITQFYANVRAGKYVGREQDRLNDEAFIFECQNAGRVL